MDAAGLLIGNATTTSNASRCSADDLPSFSRFWVYSSSIPTCQFMFLSLSEFGSSKMSLTPFPTDTAHNQNIHPSDRTSFHPLVHRAKKITKQTPNARHDLENICLSFLASRSGSSSHRIASISILHVSSHLLFSHGTVVIITHRCHCRCIFIIIIPLPRPTLTLAPPKTLLITLSPLLSYPRFTFTSFTLVSFCLLSSKRH